MEFFEAAVLAYLTASPNRFVSPHFSLPYKSGQGGSCPDFVVLDFGKVTVYVVEVTAASSIGGILSRVREKDRRWIRPLKDHLTKTSDIFHGWEYKVAVFVREEVREGLRKALAEEPNVFVESLDKVVFSWRWDWRGNTAMNKLE